MRIVTNNPLFSAARSTAQLQAISARLHVAQDRAITGLEVNRPSDAPGRWAEIHGLASDRADQDVWRTNAGRALDVLDVADGTLASAADTVQVAWERAIQLANSNYSAEERANTAVEIAGLRESLVAFANTEVAGKRLFAGDAYDGPAFDAAGTYLGGPATQAAQVSRTASVLVAIDGSTVFSGPVDAFAALSDLEAALLANDPTAITASIDNLKAAHTQLVGAREEIGFRQERVNDAVAVADALSATLDTRLYAATAADPAEAYTNLAALQTSYEAALQVVAGSSGTKLFDYLR